MNVRRALTMVVRDLRLGPRSPVFTGIVVLPLVMTFIVQVLFLRVFDPAMRRPRLGIYDAGSSRVTSVVKKMESIQLKMAGDPEQLKRLVELEDVDVGLVLQRGFDDAVRAGRRPELGFYVAGESWMSNRIILAVTTIDLIRQLENKPGPVEVVVHPAGDRSPLPIKQLLTLLLVFWVVVALGMFVPAFMLVEEREQGTLSAMLVTPARISDVLLAKGILGLLVAIPMAFVTLGLNSAIPTDAAAMLATIAVAAMMCVEMGLVYGTISTDTKMLFTLLKTLNVFILIPVLFYVFPSWPQWIAKLVPTYWFIDPLYRVALRGATFAEVRLDLAIALAICAAGLAPIAWLGRRLRATLAST